MKPRCAVARKLKTHVPNPTKPGGKRPVTVQQQPNPQFDDEEGEEADEHDMRVMRQREHGKFISLETFLKRHGRR
jgi:hypothetical protein